MVRWYVVLWVFCASVAIFTLPGNTPTRSAALAQPAVRRVAGRASPAAQASSATPLPRITSRCPGTRIPALVISRAFAHNGVDHRSYDTTSILATIERTYGLAPLSSRDAAVNDLSHAVAVGGR